MHATYQRVAPVIARRIRDGGLAANISILGIPLGATLLALGLNLWKALLVAVIGAFGSFAIVGAVSIAGRRGGAPSLTCGRPVFGVEWRALGSWIVAAAIGYLFTRAQVSADEVWFTGALYDTWIGENGLGWVVVFVLAGLLYLGLGAGGSRSAVADAKRGGRA
ncbi:cytosine permease [Agromyces sp. NPDC060279]|uniref:cytosine permease n=1 Tax=Agromyces sp. NPDC060279 TaxID=3347092 RepID=UPI00365C4FF7